MCSAWCRTTVAAFISSYLLNLLPLFCCTPGLTALDPSHLLNVATATVSRLERGTQWTDFPTLLGLCELYGVEWAELMAIPGGTDSARLALVQEIIDALRSVPAEELEVVRDVVAVMVKGRRAASRRRQR